METESIHGGNFNYESANQALVQDIRDLIKSRYGDFREQNWRIDLLDGTATIAGPQGAKLSAPATTMKDIEDLRTNSRNRRLAMGQIMR
jgi:hypothetical protein